MAVNFLIALVLFFAFIAAYLKYYEKIGIYFPYKTVSYSPLDISLKYENIYLQTEDGVQLHGWFVPAANARGTLLYCHGNAGNIGHRLDMIKTFNQLKLNVFIFDYRGYGKSQGRPSEEGLYRDAAAAYEYLLGRGGIDAEKIVFYGESIGANVSIKLASRVQPAALIAHGGFSSALDMGRTLFPWLPVKWIITIKYDAAEKIKDVHAPKLIIHSRDDEVVPFKLGRKIFDAAAEPKEFYVMSGGHNDAVFLAGEEYAEKIDGFLNAHL
mgnify:CR=1 FL=1